MEQESIVCLMGPTGCGKTALAMRLAQQFPFEIISVDSAMIYRGMDIGTAKPSLEELEKAPHHLIDICDPSEVYSAADFRRDALVAIHKIKSQGKIPLLVGGTMFYFKALQEGLSDLLPADKHIRQQIVEEAAVQGWSKMHEKLCEIDPAASKKIHPNDVQRIQRALELYRLTGKARSTLCLENPPDKILLHCINIAVMPSDKLLLNKRITERFGSMLASGFIKEVKKLFDRGDLSLDYPSMRSVGYRQAWQYLSGQIDAVTMKEKTTIATRQLAKRQLTWLKRWPDLITFSAEDSDIFQKIVSTLEI